MEFRIRTVIREQSLTSRGKKYTRYIIILPKKLVDMTDLRKLVGKEIEIIIKGEDNEAETKDVSTET